MLNKSDPIATVAVKDMKTAKSFYEGKLGLELIHSEGGGANEYRAGASKILVYMSQFAGTNQATAVTWLVDDVEALVRTLKTKGVTFERYDLPDVKRTGDIHEGGGRKLAWFKDPDGNIHALIAR
jgi:catechol 2,3-dioxygenase-like lactoylglutathione lyase family enzyme